jgi:GAF domain-containing protein
MVNDLMPAHETPNVLHHLANRLAAAPPDHLSSTATQVLQALHSEWPDITRAEVYLCAQDGTCRRAAGIGVPDDAPTSPPPDSPAAEAFANQANVTPAPDAAPLQWAVPILGTEAAQGVLAVHLPAEAARALDEKMLSALAAILSLALEYVPRQRALMLGRRLAQAESLPALATVAAAFFDGDHALYDLTWYLRDDDAVVQVWSQRAEGWLAAEDDPLLPARPTLHNDDPVFIPVPADSSLLAEGAFQDAAGLTLVPLRHEGQLAGVLAVSGPALFTGDLHGLSTLAEQLTVLAGHHMALDASAIVWLLDDAVHDADEPAALVQALYDQLDPPPDSLSLDAIQRDAEDHIAALTAVAATPGDASGARVEAGDDLRTALADGTPLLANHPQAGPTAYMQQRGFGAMAMFPVVIPGKPPTHTLTAAYTTPHLYTAAEIRRLHQLSYQVGAQLERWTWQQSQQAQQAQVKRQARVLEALYDIARQLSAHLTGPDTLHSVCQTLAAALATDYAAVVRFDQVPASGNIVAEHPARLGMQTLLTLEDFGGYKHLQDYHAPLAAQLVDDDQPGPPDDRLGPNRGHFTKSGLHSLLLVPLLVHGDLIGMLVAASQDAAHTFPSAHIQAAQTAASQIALGLYNAQLFTDIQRRANQLEQIAAFGRLVSSTFDRDEILRRVMDVIPNLLPADQVSLSLYSGVQPHMQIISLTNRTEMQEDSFAAAGSSIEEVIKTQAPLLVPDLKSSDYTDHQRLAAQGLNSALTVPLVMGGHPLGALNISHRRSRIYTPTDITLIQQIGNQIAIALENARLFQTTQQRVSYEEALGDITSQLQQPADLRDLLQQTMRELGQALGARRVRVRLRTPSSPNGGGK